MASPSLAARAAILGVPYQPKKRPDPVGVVRAIEALDAKAMATSAGAIVRDTLANLNAVTTPPAHQMGWVTGDATTANNGIYENAGSPSAPNWQRRADLPFGVIHMINAGAGTADAIIATSSLPTPSGPGSALFTVNIVAENTGPVTINGKPLRTNSGNEIVPGGLTADSISAFLDLGDHYRLLSDQASASIVAAAESWAIQAGDRADDAENAADRAEGFAAMQSADKVKFKTVPLLLADTLMSYTAAPGKIHVGTGDRFSAGGFRYEVAASGTADHHVETAGGVNLYVLDSPTVTVEAFGAVFSGDESAIAMAMIAALGVLRVPRGRALTAKGIEITAPTRFEVDGSLRLPDGCVDDDRLIYADQVSDVTGYINEIDGNYDGQSGNIGTHLVYLTRCPRAKLRIGTVRDHYISTAAPMTSNDGFRNVSTGAVWLYQCAHADVSIDYIHGWGREAFYAQDCEDGTFLLGFAQGHATRNTEYSALQVSGKRNVVLRASADFCGASAVGFDTTDGEISNILATNTRENSGVNFGHPGRPATGSIASNIVVDGAWGAGIIAAAATKDLKLTNFSVQNTGERGLQMSDNADGLVAANGRIAFSGRWNIVSGGVGAELSLASVRSDELDPMVLHISAASGLFEDGETVIGPSGSGVVRRVLRNLTGVQQKLFLASSSGTFSASEAVTGGTSGASGTIDIAAVPVQYNEGAGSFIVDDSRLVTGPSGQYARHADGTAEWWASITVAATANVEAIVDTIFNAGMTWTEAPIVLVSLRGAVSSNTFDVSKLQASATTTQVTTRLNASSTQSYLVTLYARGKWRADS